MKNLIRELLVKALISESKKTEYEYQIRDIGSSDVYYNEKRVINYGILSKKMNLMQIQQKKTP